MKTGIRQKAIANSAKVKVFCLALSAMLLVHSFPVEAQQPKKIPQVGFLGSSSGHHVQTLREGLRELGYEDGRNIAIVKRLAYRKVERLPKLAKELVNLKVDVMVAAQGRAAQVAKEVTSTTPNRRCNWFGSC